MGLAEVGPFLESVAQTEKDPVRALAASRDARDFLYLAVLRSALTPEECYLEVDVGDQAATPRRG